MTLKRVGVHDSSLTDGLAHQEEIIPAVPKREEMIHAVNIIWKIGNVSCIQKWPCA